ncbi:MAG: DivIVA domain-containing protein [Acidimicrobiales bacterium]|nr:DivIVA domain-containing protein [Acidimicrobiales bacterium]
MDEVSPLFQEIEFHERLRGYDPDEVDAYVDRVARAAAVLRGRLMELQERVDAAESRERAGAAGSTESEETLTRTLVLAQRTADAAIAEAQEEADRVTADAATSAQAILSGAEAEAQVTLREAQAEAAGQLRESEDRAAFVLAEAETDRRSILAEAESLAAQAAIDERDRIAAEVSELQEYRAFLADDIEILERHLGEERHQLTVSLSALTDLLESPDAFRSSRAPETSGVSVDEGRLESIAIDLTTEPADSAESLDSHALDVEPEVDAEETVETTADEVVLDEAEIIEAAVEESVELPEVEIAAAEEISGEEPAVEDVVDDFTMEDIAVEDVAPAVNAAQPESTMVDDVVVADPDPEPEPVGAPVFAPSEFDEFDASTIDLVAAEVDDLRVPESEEVALSEIDLDGAVLDDGRTTWADDVAYTTVAEAPSVASPPRLVTAADPESSTRAAPAPPVDGGPATAPVPTIHEESLFSDPVPADADPFLSQLRDAMEGEVVVDSDDDALTAFFDQEDDEGDRSWFGRRR